MRLLDRKPWQIIVGFAVVGLAMAVASYAYLLFHEPAKQMSVLDFAMMFASFVLCPAQLLVLAICMDCKTTGWYLFVIYSKIGALNMVLYAIIGKIVSYSRKSY